MMLNLFYLILFLVTLLSSLAKQEELKPIKVVETNSSVSFGLIEVSEDKQSPTSGFSLWSEWSDCNVTCGRGFRKRERTCLTSSEYCQGSKLEMEPCERIWCRFYKEKIKVDYDIGDGEENTFDPIGLRRI